MDNVLPSIGSVWYRTLYPNRLYIVIGHSNENRYGSVKIQRVDTGSLSIQPSQSFTFHYSPLESMETK